MVYAAANAEDSFRVIIIFFQNHPVPGGNGCAYNAKWVNYDNGSCTVYVYIGHP